MKLTHSSFAAALFVVAFGTVACGSTVSPSEVTGDGGSNETGSAVTADQACTEIAAAYCEKINGCIPLYLSIGFGDLATCKQRFALNCKPGFSAPGTSATPADTAACAKAAPSIACSSLLDNDVPAVCQPKPGAIDDGKACANDAQCKSAFCGMDEKTMLCGTCAPKPALGADCIKKKCGPGLVCSTKDKCVKPGATGAACSADAPCASGLGCVASKCTALLATENAPCGEKVGQAECDIAKGFICITDKCKRLKLAPAGGECGVVVDSTTTPPSVKELIACDKAGYCKGGSPGVSMGKCEPFAAEGAPCSASEKLEEGPKCMGPAHCIDGVCKLQDPLSCK